MRRDRGFTLIELMVVLAITVFVLAATSKVLTGLFGQFKQQTKIAETSVQSAVGLDILRQDLGQAGFGLPHQFESAIAYTEASSGSDEADFNDAPGGPPRAIIANNPSFATMNDSDYLVIKSMTAATNPAAGKWHYLNSDNTANVWSHPTKSAVFNLRPTDRVVVESIARVTNATVLEVSATGAWFTQKNNTAAFAPDDVYDTNIIYGVDPDHDLKFPFNRSDYYISDDPALVPKRCAGAAGGAPKAGVLVKKVFAQVTDPEANATIMPLLDCVSDMQVVFRLDTDGDGVADAPIGDINGLDAGEIREQVKQVQVYLLVHEGAKDPYYTHPVNQILVGPDTASGRLFDLPSQIGTDWANYRWRVIVLTEKPNFAR
jgi:prepilin-type N-terminal cleavage/methylation domain-containing protein